MKKLTSAKLKAHLAMAAFIVVATAMLFLTTIGTLGYMTQPVDMPVTSQKAVGTGVPFGVAAAWGAILIQGK